MSQPVVILSAVRTAIGSFGGALKDVSPADFASIVIREAIGRASIRADMVGHVVMGQVIPTVPQDVYLARAAALTAGVPAAVPALTLNRLCGSGAHPTYLERETAAATDTDERTSILHLASDLVGEWFKIARR